MGIADELRRDADAALKEDGMYYSGEYLDGIAKRVEEVEAENAKLREQGARLFDKTLELATENAKLRDLIFDMLVDEERGHNDDDTYYEHVRLAKGLGIEMKRWA